MAFYSSVIPFLNIAPPPGYRFHQILPLDRLAEQITSPTATLDLRRDVYLEGTLVDRKEGVLVLRNDEWIETGAETYELDEIDGSDWIEGHPIAFIETRIDARDATFTRKREPSSYVVFSSAYRKSFLSDNNQKFSHPAVIEQVAAYGKWAEGYPACTVDPRCNADQSVVLINPYQRPAIATLEFEGITEKRRIRVEACSARRIAFSETLGSRYLPWAGQAYVWGPNRVVVFFVSHAYDDPAEVNTMEHTDPYRGHSYWFPFTRSLHWKWRSKNGLR
jgi:hypothetical protein